jgi:DnaK suppressor protein
MAKSKIKPAVKKKPATKKPAVKKSVKAKSKPSKVKSKTAKKPVSKPAKKTTSGRIKSSSKKIILNGKASPVSKSKTKAKSKTSKKSKSKYTVKDLKYFKEIILKERKQILESAKANMEALVDHESGEYVGDNSTYSTHMAEQGTDEMEREKNYMFVQRDEKYLGYLNDALIRIDNGTYGICINCRKLIPKERLVLVPVTQHCIKCKTIKG